MAGFISGADAATLLAAREVLKAWGAAAIDAALPSRLPETSFVLATGRFMEACDRADRGIFEALNVASAYLHDPVAADAIGSLRS